MDEQFFKLEVLLVNGTVMQFEGIDVVEYRYLTDQLDMKEDLRDRSVALTEYRYDPYKDEAVRGFGRSTVFRMEHICAVSIVARYTSKDMIRYHR